MDNKLTTNDAEVLEWATDTEDDGHGISSSSDTYVEPEDPCPSSNHRALRVDYADPEYNPANEVMVCG